jgi:hypothetical protein
LKAISPTEACGEVSGFTMIVTGTNFINSSKVIFNGIEKITTYVSTTELTVNISTADLTPSQRQLQYMDSDETTSIPILVRNPAPGGGDSNILYFLLIINFTATFGGPEDDVAYSVQQTLDGGYIIAGYTDSYGSGKKDMYLVKTDCSGSKVWEKTFGGAEDDYAISVQETFDSGYILAGETWSYGAGLNDMYLVKTDSLGNKVWQKVFGGRTEDYANSVQQTSDGGYILAGVTVPYATGSPDIYIVRTDSSGSIVWQKAFRGSDDDYAYSIQQTSDGGYIIAGSKYSYGVSWEDMYLVKVDSSGRKVWENTFGGTRFEIAYSVQQTSDGGYILAGRTYVREVGEDDVFLVKTDSSGSKVWEKTFGGIKDDLVYSVQQTSDGGYILAGFTGSYGAGSDDMYLVKTDSFGNKLWQETFGGAEGDEAISVQQTSDGGYILAGFTRSYGSGNYDMYIVKTDSSSSFAESQEKAKHNINDNKSKGNSVIRDSQRELFHKHLLINHRK